MRVTSKVVVSSLAIVGAAGLGGVAAAATRTSTISVRPASTSTIIRRVMPTSAITTRGMDTPAPTAIRRQPVSPPTPATSQTHEESSAGLGSDDHQDAAEPTTGFDADEGRHSNNGGAQSGHQDPPGDVQHEDQSNDGGAESGHQDPPSDLQHEVQGEE